MPAGDYKFGMCDECFVHHMVLKITAWKLYEYQCAYINAARGRSLLKVLNRGNSRRVSQNPTTTKKQREASSTPSRSRTTKQKTPNMSPKSTKKTNDKNTSRGQNSTLNLPLSSAPPQESPFARSPPVQRPFPGFLPHSENPSPHDTRDEFPPYMHQNPDEDTSRQSPSPSSLFHSLTLDIDDTHELPKWLHFEVTKSNFLDYVYASYPHLCEPPHEQKLVPYPDPIPLKVSASNPVKEENQENFEVNFPLNIGIGNKMFLISGESFSSGLTPPDAPPPSPTENQMMKNKVTKKCYPEHGGPMETTTGEGGSSSSPSPTRGGARKPDGKQCCHTCGKKLGISTMFDCRCGFIFCSKHSYSEEHDCEFDYREFEKQRVRENNPVVRGEKIRKI